MSHYYEKLESGEVVPRHFVPNASRPGELRATTLRDAKKFGWVASVTTIQNLLDRAALNDWRITEHLKCAYEWLDTWDWKGEKGLDYALDAWIREIKECTKDALDKAPQQGTDFHDSMEQFILGNLLETHEHFKLAAATAEFMREKTLVDSHVWIAEKSFVSKQGFGGKVDAHYVSLSENNWIIDWKTKNTADKWKPGKMHYPEMAMQLAAYRVGLMFPSARCANVFVCLETGQLEFHEWKADELDKQWANFADLLRIWLRNADYVPLT